MTISNLQEPGKVLKKIYNPCLIKSPQNFQDCQDCRYRHKGLCNVSFECKTSNYHKNESISLEEKLEIMTISTLTDSEPVINLNTLFYEIDVNQTIKISKHDFPQKAKYDNFKLLTDIQRVLQKCTHLTAKDRLNYCTTQRYFMKLYLREINKTI
ncbi:MAG: hypothetical protein ACW99E_06950 [Promethearchaeota archaeon]